MGKYDHKRRTWRIAWANPYTSPPAGEPRVLAIEVTTYAYSQPRILDSIIACPKGYGLFHESIDLRPRRKLSAETKQRIREQRELARQRAAAPLFAQEKKNG